MPLTGSTGILLWQQSLSETVGSMQLAAFADPTPIHLAHHESQLSRQALAIVSEPRKHSETGCRGQAQQVETLSVRGQHSEDCLAPRETDG